MDLATANSSATVSILLGNGNGTFKPHVNYGIAAEPRHLASGDFNDDGVLDIATANLGSSETGNTVSVLLGNGDGTFESKIDLLAGAAPNAVHVADLNGDGNLDLAVANLKNAGAVNVLHGNGDGAFALAIPYSVVTYPGSLSAADVNGDGFLDLGVRSTVGGAMSLLMGKPDGTFDPVHLALGDPEKSISPPAPLVFADADGDGWHDVMAAQISDVAVLLNDGIWPPLPIGNGPRPFAPLDVGDTTTMVHPTDRQMQTSSRSTINPVDDNATAIAIRPKNTSRHIARVALAETTESEIELFSTKLS